MGLVPSSRDLHSPVGFAARCQPIPTRDSGKAARFWRKRTEAVHSLHLSPGPAGAFCLANLSRDERRDASTGSRPLLRLGLYLNGGALPATTTSTSTSTHRLSQCVDRTSGGRKRGRERKRWKKENVERNTRLRGKKISAFAMRKYLRDTWYVGTHVKYSGDV